MRSPLAHRYRPQPNTAAALRTSRSPRPTRARSWHPFHVQRAQRSEQPTASSMTRELNNPHPREDGKSAQVYARPTSLHKILANAIVDGPSPGSVPTSYPPPRVRNSRASKRVFLSAVSGENVQPPRHAPAVVHDLSTEMTGCPESDFSCSDSETRTWSVTVQTIELCDRTLRGFALDLGKTYLKGDDEISRPLRLLHTLAA